ncbi:putative uncharacterized protein DDB_G0291608 [Cimex lectularius]|uniref:SCA7 domain-containing protein n=1 Tax=Cimex lectularius TaxID=79782 RepID=A0A8I6TDC9_CIMLE|nr:putative uncharacterized protein DDB_G0291608 [Cimex lectularius]
MDKLVINKLKSFVGQPWSALTSYFNHTILPDLADEAVEPVGRIETHSVRLNKEDMAIFGYCPAAEVFELAICNFCGDKFKIPALADHINLKHEDGKCSTLKISEYEKKYGMLQSKKKGGRHKKANIKEEKEKSPEEDNAQAKESVGKSLEQLIDVKIVLRESIPTPTPSTPIHTSTPTTPTLLSPSTPSSSSSSTSTSISTQIPLSTPTVTPVGTPVNTPSVTPSSTPIKSSPELSRKNSTSTNISTEIKLKQIKNKIKKAKLSEKHSSSGKSGKNLSVLSSKLKDKSKELIPKKTNITKIESASSPKDSSSFKDCEQGPNMQPVVQLSPLGSISKNNSSLEQKKKGKLGTKPSTMRDRIYNPDKHCGVVSGKDNAKPCTRSLTCKSHSMTLRRAVKGRSKAFDILLADHRAEKEQMRKNHVNIQILSDGDKSNDSSTNLKITLEKPAVSTPPKIENCDKQKIIKGTTIQDYSKLSLPVSIKNPSLLKQIQMTCDEVNDDRQNSQSPKSQKFEQEHQSQQALTIPNESAQAKVLTNEQCQLQKSHTQLQLQLQLTSQSPQAQPQQLQEQLNQQQQVPTQHTAQEEQSSQQSQQLFVRQQQKQLQQLQLVQQKLQAQQQQPTLQQSTIKVIQPQVTNLQQTKILAQQLTQQTQQGQPAKQPQQQTLQFQQLQQQKQLIQQQQIQLQKHQLQQMQSQSLIYKHQAQILLHRQQQQFLPQGGQFSVVTNTGTDFKRQVRNVILFRTKENGREIGIIRPPFLTSAIGVKLHHAPIRAVLPPPTMQPPPQPPTPPPPKTESDCDESDTETQDDAANPNAVKSIIEWWQPGFKRSRGLWISKTEIPHKRAKYKNKNLKLASKNVVSNNFMDLTKNVASDVKFQEIKKANSHLLRHLSNNSHVTNKEDIIKIPQITPADLDHYRRVHKRPKRSRNFFLFNSPGKMRKSDIPTNLVGPIHISPAINFTPVVRLALSNNIVNPVLQVRHNPAIGGTPAFNSVTPNGSLNLGYPGLHYITSSGPFPIAIHQLPDLHQKLQQQVIK